MIGGGSWCKRSSIRCYLS